MPSASSSSSKAADKLAAVTSVQEPKDINYKISPVMWNYKDNARYQEHDFGSAMTDLRLDLNTQQASTVEVDIEDSDFTLLSNVLFANWAFNIENVAVDSQRKFKTVRLTNSTDTTYLGDTSNLEWVLGQRPIDFEIGDVFYRLCGIQTQQTTATLSFEDRTASLLRDKSGSKSWERGKHTRAQFVAMLCREAGVDYFIPEIDVKQPVEIDKTSTGTSTPAPAVTGNTIDKGAFLTVKGHPANKTQRAVATQICQIGEKLKAPADAVMAVLFDCVYESGMGMALDSGGAYVGILGGSRTIFAADLSSAAAEITAAFRGGQGYTSAISLAKQNPGKIAWIGSQCTRPTPFDANGISTQYESQSVPGGIQGTVHEAEAFLQAYGGPGFTASTRAVSSSGPYTFTRGANEDSWDCIQRLASEVAWYAFVRQNKLWFVSGNYLFQQESQLVVEQGKTGVRWIDVNLDMGARDQIAECNVYVETSLWTALPGMVVTVKNRGPATGKWFVSEVQSTPKDPTQTAQVTLYKPVPKRAEPAKGSGSSSTPKFASGSGSASAAYQAAKALSDKKLKYTQGVRTLRHLNQIPQGATMYDCSSSVGDVLLLAGFTLPGNLSFGSWGPTTKSDWLSVCQRGKGQQMTIWLNPVDHMFIEFNIPGVGHFQANTNCSQDNAGFRLEPWAPMGSVDAQSSSFFPIHYPGT